VLKKAWKLLPAIAAVSLAGVAATAGTASADSTSGTRQEPALQQVGVVTSTLSDLFHVGDCTQFPGSSSVSLSQPDSAGNAILEWRATANTKHTNNADIWHISFKFKNNFNQIVLAAPQLDGARMTVINSTYTWVRRAVVKMDPQVYPFIDQVEWRSSC